jgi:RimJ/RimL family protein N-acetyltransferase
MEAGGRQDARIALEAACGSGAAPPRRDRPAAANAAAVRAYEKVGFRPVGVIRAYERDAGGAGRHDGLPMELVLP